AEIFRVQRKGLHPHLALDAVGLKHGAEQNALGQMLRGRSGGAGGGPGALLRLLLGLRLLGVVVLYVLPEPCIRQEAMHALRWGSALSEPGLRLVEIELQTVGMIFGEQRIVVAEPLDETAVARAARFRHHDGIMRALLGAAAR